MKSAFLPIEIDYSRNTSLQQAQIILEEVNRLSKQGYKKIGITYSANHGQTKKIRRCYNQNIWITDTDGANQADVIHELETLLKNDLRYRHLQGIFRILPITTMGATDLGRCVDEDLKEITHFIQENNNVVLGWQNQRVKGSHYAVGGGVAGALPKEINSNIQKKLQELSRDFQPPVPKVITAAKTKPTPGPMFQPPKQTSKQIPISDKIKHASEEISDAIKKEQKMGSSPIIRPGNLAHTFKVAFDNKADAVKFFNYLKSLNYNVTYFNQNGGEKYPMDKEGRVVMDKSTPVQYRDIIRFEVRTNEKFPADALDYLQELGLLDAEKLYSQIMGKSALKTLKSQGLKN